MAIISVLLVVSKWIKHQIKAGELLFLYQLLSYVYCNLVQVHCPGQIFDTLAYPECVDF